MSKLELGAMSFPESHEIGPKRLAGVRHRRTKIVSTLGPASRDMAMITRLFDMGVDVFRLNFSHGSHEDHAARIAIIREIEWRSGRPIGILADMQGPKLRIGRFSGGRVQLQPRQSFRFDLSPTPGNARRVQLPHPEIIEAAQSGTNLLLDDGKLRVQVVHKRPDALECTVLVGGPLSDRKGVNVPDVLLPIPALTAKDLEDLNFALAQGVDYIGLSFVQRPEDVLKARELVGERAWILSKIEKPLALANIKEIVRLSDAVMVARGDLGVELPPEEVPLAQKIILQHARAMGRPVIVATQMLESMITAPTPTRAEASDVATAVFDGADAVMLSAETAAGQYPAEAVNIMDRIVSRAEHGVAIGHVAPPAPAPVQDTIPGAICAAASQVAQNTKSSAIAAFTHAGHSACNMARERPLCPIIAISPEVSTARCLSLVWGTHPVVSRSINSMDEAVALAAEIAYREKFAKPAEMIAVIAGMPFGISGTTNALRVSVIP